MWAQFTTMRCVCSFIKSNEGKSLFINNAWPSPYQFQFPISLSLRDQLASNPILAFIWLALQLGNGYAIGIWIRNGNGMYFPYLDLLLAASSRLPRLILATFNPVFGRCIFVRLIFCLLMKCQQQIECLTFVACRQWNTNNTGHSHSWTYVCVFV